MRSNPPRRRPVSIPPERGSDPAAPRTQPQALSQRTAPGRGSPLRSRPFLCRIGRGTGRASPYSPPSGRPAGAPTVSPSPFGAGGAEDAAPGFHGGSSACSYSGGGPGGGADRDEHADASATAQRHATRPGGYALT